MHDQKLPITKHTFNRIKRKIIFGSTNPNDRVELLGDWNGWGSSAIM